jgi:hypothetical protein
MEVEMATIDGGILGGNREEIARGVAELERKEAAAAERAADQEKSVNKIEDALTAWLRTELAEEIAARKRLSPETMRAYKSDFQRFKQCCAEWKLPCLPAPAHPSLQGGNLGCSSCRRPR